MQAEEIQGDQEHLQEVYNGVWTSTLKPLYIKHRSWLYLGF